MHSLWTCLFTFSYFHSSFIPRSDVNFVLLKAQGRLYFPNWFSQQIRDRQMLLYCWCSRRGWCCFRTFKFENFFWGGASFNEMLQTLTRELKSVFLLPVWPEKSHQMSIKVAQKWFHSKNERFWQLYKNCLKCGWFGQNNCCHRPWNFAHSAINRQIWSHCLLSPKEEKAELIPTNRHPIRVSLSVCWFELELCRDVCIKSFR